MKARDKTPSRSQTRPPLADVEGARDLYGQRAWAAAHEALSRADRAGALAGEDLERLALAAYLIGRDADYLEQLQRAHQAYRRRERRRPGRARGVLAGIAAAVRGEVGQRERLAGPRASGCSIGSRATASSGDTCCSRSPSSRSGAGDLEAASAAAQRRRDDRASASRRRISSPRAPPAGPRPAAPGPSRRKDCPCSTRPWSRVIGGRAVADGHGASSTAA